MLDSDNYTLDFLKEKYEQAESRWKKESYLALMKMKGFDEKETEILRFDNAFKSKSASDVGAILEYLNYSTPNTEITERLKQFVEVILDKSDAFSKDLVQNISLPTAFKIIESQIEWKTNPNKILYFFYLIAKHCPSEFGSILNEFLMVFKYFKTTFKSSLENTLKLNMFLFHVYKVPAIREAMPQNPELYRGMLNACILANLSSQLFTKEILSPFGLPHVKLPSEQLHLGLGCLCLKVQPSLAATVTPATISKTFEILVQSASADDKDVIISALLFGLCTWKHFVGENLLLLLPANVYNMREKTFKDFHGFPLKFDIESIHRGIGKKSSECQPLIDSLKLTISLLKKYSKIVAHVNFFHDYVGIEHSAIWNYLLTSLLLFNEHMLATNFLAMQTDVSLSNLLLLQNEVALGKIHSAITIANEIILNASRSEFHNAPFRPAILIENCYISVSKGAVIQYAALIQAHLSYLTLLHSNSWRQNLRDFAIGDILVMAQILQRFGEGEVIATLMTDVVKANGSFTFPNFDQYICQSHIFTPFFNLPSIKWDISSPTRSLQDAIQFGLAALPPNELDPLSAARKFIRTNAAAFSELKNC